MFNLQPGQGLGFTGSELIAYGLGSGLEALAEQPAPEYHGGGMLGGAWDELEYDRIRHRILREDEEMIEIIIQAILSGVLD